MEILIQIRKSFVQIIALRFIITQRFMVWSENVEKPANAIADARNDVRI